MHLRLHCKQMTTEDTVPTEETLDSVNEGGNAVQSTVNHTDSEWTPPRVRVRVRVTGGLNTSPRRWTQGLET